MSFQAEHRLWVTQYFHRTRIFFYRTCKLMFSLYGPLGLLMCGWFWRRPRHWHLLWAAFMSTNSELAMRWTKSFRSLDYLVLFYSQVIATRKGPISPLYSRQR